ncbi:hypothetical protein [Olivibacter sitiensis]|uniref:hypothetical protein n=1 Tax=Olivibacter sitiensis TaxID=376470 RepID=UPI0003F96DC2|nr:hypothetical protein [Olivibacter sitiensis]
MRRWAGQIDELATASEPSHLYLLSQMPQSNEDLRTFITDFLQGKSSDKVRVDIVTPENVSSVTSTLEGQIRAHEEMEG